ncbi:hypothetical protein ACOMHN_046680 [Nucella lapillus]
MDHLLMLNATHKAMREMTLVTSATISAGVESTPETHYEFHVDMPFVLKVLELFLLFNVLLMASFAARFLYKVTSVYNNKKITSIYTSSESLIYRMCMLPHRLLSAILHRPQPSDKEGQVYQIRLIEADPERDPVYRPVTVPLTSQSVHVQHE